VNTLRFSVAYVAITGMLAACASSATAQVQHVDVPATFAPASASPVYGPSAASVDQAAFFADDTLLALITEALAGNPDLQIAVERVELARAAVTRVTAPLWPTLSVRTDAGLTRWPRYTVEGAGNAGTDITRGRAVPNPVGDLSLGFEAGWEADLWGRLRRARDAARTEVLASREGANLVVTGLVEAVAAAYVELVALDDVSEVLAKTIVRQAEAVLMMRAQKEAGRTTELAVKQFEAQLAATRAQAAATVRQVRELESALVALVGRTSGGVVRSREYLRRGDDATPSVGAPSDLLRNRPDVREAELRIQAAGLSVDAARAAYYPRLTLSTGVSYRAFEPRYLFSTPQSLGYQAFAGVSLPLLNLGDLDADLTEAEATRVQAIHAYRGTVQRAFAEVQAGLAGVEQASEVVSERQRRQAAIAGTVDAADALFRAGKASYLEVLLAQQGSLEAEIELIEALRDRHLARIGLYKALGGGWQGAGAPRDE